MAPIVGNKYRYTAEACKRDPRHMNQKDEFTLIRVSAIDPNFALYRGKNGESVMFPDDLEPV